VHATSHAHHRRTLCEQLTISKSTKSTKKQTQNESRIIAKVLRRVEDKKQDKFLEYNSNTTASSSWTFLEFTDTIIQGVGQQERIGNQVLLRKIKGKIACTVADSTNFVRFIIFRWVPSTTSDLPTVGELFLPNSSNAWYSSFLPVKPSRFSVLWDYTFCLTTSGVGCFVKEVNQSLNFRVGYDVGVNTGTNHLFLAYCSDSAAVSHPSYYFNLVTHFHDTA